MYGLSTPAMKLVFQKSQYVESLLYAWKEHEAHDA